MNGRLGYHSPQQQSLTMSLSLRWEERRRQRWRWSLEPQKKAPPRGAFAVCVYRHGAFGGVRWWRGRKIGAPALGRRPQPPASSQSPRRRCDKKPHRPFPTSLRPPIHQWRPQRHQRAQHGEQCGRGCGEHLPRRGRCCGGGRTAPQSFQIRRLRHYFCCSMRSASPKAGRRSRGSTICPRSRRRHSARTPHPRKATQQ